MNHVRAAFSRSNIVQAELIGGTGRKGEIADMRDSEDTKEWIRQFIKRKKDTRKETFKQWADSYLQDRGVDVEDEMFRVCGEGKMLSYQGSEAHMRNACSKEAGEEFYWSYTELVQVCCSRITHRRDLD